jgi:hypothetical protein
VKFVVVTDVICVPKIIEEVKALDSNEILTVGMEENSVGKVTV